MHLNGSNPLPGAKSPEMEPVSKNCADHDMMTMVAAMILVMGKKSDSDDDERPIIKVEWDMK